MRMFFAFAVAIALVCATREAAAGGCGRECGRAIADVAVFLVRNTTTVDFDGNTSFYAAPPDVRALSYSAGSVRGVPRGLAMTGMSIDAIHVTDDHFILPLLGLGVAVPLQSWDGLASDDGAGTFAFDSRLAFSLLLPGLGYQVKEGPWTFSATVRTALVDFYSSGRFNAAVDGSSDVFESNALTFAVRADFSACDRLDDDARLCAFVAPNAYEYSWANGGTIGVRLQLGK